ncbi:hypothetical protein BSKO_14018 [Bryopsis sp. KO-2023]|nr:hypothetical protein BSKO_14018 [Bryopsis sp. KO-2023]
MATRPPCDMIMRFLKMIEHQGILDEAWSSSGTTGSLVLKVAPHLSSTCILHLVASFVRLRSTDVQVDAMKVLCEDFHLGNWLLRDTDGLRIELIEALYLANVISSVSKPVWVRLESVPIPLRYDLNLAPTQSGTLVRFSGIVARLSCVKQRVYCRRLRCSHCGAVSETLEGSSGNLCRCAVLDGEFEEDLSASLCEALGDACSQQLPPSLGIALLLSIVMVGSPRTESARNQIHVLITSDGYDPGAVRLLQEIANLIAPHSLTHSESAGAMKCCVENGGDESSGKCGMEVSGNAITSTRNGILVMETTQIKRANKAYVTDCLGRSSIQPHPADEFIVPMRSTLWASHCLNGAKPQKKGTKESISKESVLGVELGEGLVSHMDIVVPFSMRVDPLYDSMAVERILGIDEDEASSEKPAESSIWKLREHLGWVGRKPCPTMSDHAKDLMQRYYMSVRNSEEEDFRVYTSILPSLMRLAAASAKLCGRSQVQESPDVGLAIKLVEETMVAKEVYSRPSPLLLSMDSVLENSQAISIDQELDCLQSIISMTLGKEICFENEE